MNFRSFCLVEHDQIGMIEQIIQNRIIVQSIAIAVETGMNIVFPAGRKPNRVQTHIAIMAHRRLPVTPPPVARR